MGGEGGGDIEEVTYRDLIDGTGKHKIGYEKIRSCGEQARRDGLYYFWVVNSMFRWYENVVKCYVFSSDVLRPTVNSKDRADQVPWESAVRTSGLYKAGPFKSSLL
jgi:hypothetical protein